MFDAVRRQVSPTRRLLLALVLFICSVLAVSCSGGVGAATSPVVFADASGAGWQSRAYSWDCTPSYDAVPAAVGQCAVKAVLDSYGGLGFHASSPLSADDFVALAFSVRGEAGGERLRVGLYDDRKELPRTGGLKLTAPYLERITTEYQRVIIPLTAFRAAGSRISKLTFMSDTASVQALYFDQIELLRTMPEDAPTE